MAEAPTGTSSAPHPATIEFLRKLSEDRELTEGDVMKLANYLNDNREARHSWPGEGLFTMLREIFASGGIGDMQIMTITQAITKIERQYSLAKSSDMANEKVVPVESIWVDDLILPSLREKIKIQDFDVDLGAHTCSCPSWYGNRRTFKDGDARMCCNHMAVAFDLKIKADELKESPRLFPEVMADLAERGDGLDHHSVWRLLRIQMRPFVVSYGNKVDWCVVYGPNAERFVEKYNFHRTELRWSYGRHPQCGASIAAYIKSLQEG